MAHKLVIILAPGWGETHRSVSRLADVLTELGAEAIAVRRTPSQQTRESMEQRARDIISTIDQRGVTPAVVFAHSLGAIDAVRAAELAPDKISHLVLFNPAGMVGPMSRLKLLWRFGRKKLNDHKRRHERIAPGPSATNFRRGIIEGMAAARTDVRARLKVLENRGMSVVVLASRDDTLFSFDGIKAGTAPLSKNHRFIEISGRHDSIHHEAADFQDVLAQLLADLPK